MTALLTGFVARVDAILSQGRGADGALGAQAQVRSIPAGVFRPPPNNAPLGDATLGTESYDRAYRREELSIEDDPYANNTLSSSQLRVMRVALDVGYVYGEASTFIRTWPGTTESASAVVWEARQRAISDAERIKRALCFQPLYQAAGDDPAIVVITRSGATEINDLGAGRLVARTVFSVTLQLNVSEDYDPPASP